VLRVPEGDPDRFHQTAGATAWFPHGSKREHLGLRPGKTVNPTFRVLDGRLLSEEEQEQIVLLLRRAFDKGRGPSSFRLGIPPIDHLRWKARDAPWGATALLMEIESRIIGFVLGMHRRVLVNGSERVARDGVDLAIDPDFQGRGLYRSMAAFETRHAARNFDLTLTYPTHPASVHLRSERGYRELGNPLRVLWRPLDVRRFTGRAPYLPGGGARLHALGLLARARRLLSRVPAAAWSISTIHRFDERIDAFCATAAAPFAVTHRRTASSLNWRYCDPRGGSFVVRLAEREGQVLGYLALRTRGEARGQVGYIADLLALPGRRDVVSALVEDALRILAEARAVAVTCRMPAVHPYNVVLRRHGFLRSGERTGVVWSPRRLDLSHLSVLSDPDARVHLTTGDSDHI
jgi:hypothetical protein